MISTFSILKKHTENILTFATILTIISFVSHSQMITMAASIVLLAPLQLAILRDEEAGLSTLLAGIFQPAALSYSALYYALWVLPIGVLALINFDIPSIYLIGPAVILFSVSYATLAPTLYDIATKTKGTRLPVADMVKIALSLLAFYALELGLQQLPTTSAPVAIATILTLSFGLAGILCHQTAVMLRRNEVDSPPVK